MRGEDERQLKLVALLYDELPPAEADALNAAVAEDPALSAQLDAWRAIQTEAAALEAPDPDPQVHYELLRAARHAVAAPPKPSWRRWFDTLSLGPALAGLAVLGLAIGSTMWLTEGYEDAPIAPIPKAEPKIAPKIAPKAVPAEDTKANLTPKLTAPPVPKTPTAPSAIAPEAAASEVTAPKAAAPREKAKKKATGKATGRFAAQSTPQTKRKAAATPSPEPVVTAAIGAIDAAKPDHAGRAKPPQKRARRKAAPRPKRASKKRAPPPVHSKVAPAKPKSSQTRAPRPDDTIQDARAADTLDDLLVEGLVAKSTDTLDTTNTGDAPVAAPAAAAAAPAPAPAVAQAAEATRATTQAALQNQAVAAEPFERVSAPQREEARSSARPTGSSSLGGGAQGRYAPPPPPRSAAADRGRGNGMLDEAEAEVEAVVGPLDRGRAARRRGDHRGAVRAYETFISNNRGHTQMASVLFETAQSYETLGDLSRALQLYRMVVAYEGPQTAQAQARITALTAPRE